MLRYLHIYALKKSGNTCQTVNSGVFVEYDQKGIEQNKPHVLFYILLDYLKYLQ